MRRDIRRSVDYPHPVSRVWRALTDPAALAVWLMANDFRPEVGHRFTFRTDPAPGFDGVVHCEVLEIDAPRLLRISWRGGPVNATVTWQLSEVSAGTRLVLDMEGFAGPKAVAVSYLLGGGFGGMYRRDLPAVLDRIARGEGYGPPRGSAEARAGTPTIWRRLRTRVVTLLPDRDEGKTR